MDQHVAPPEISADEVRATLREWFRERSGVAEVRRNRDDGAALSRGGFDGEAWTVLAGQIGVIGIAASESWGGLGLPTAHLTAALEECGASLYPGPVRASVLMARMLERVLPEEISAGFHPILDDFFSGAIVAGVSTDVGGPPGVDLRHGKVRGRVAAVTHGPVAGLILSAVQTDDGPAIALIVAAAHPGGVHRASVPTVDLATPLADLTLENVPALALTQPGDTQAFEAYRCLEALVLAAEQVGGAEGCVAGMVEYAAMREQFGHVIGTYQAIQHRCAQSTVATAGARGLVAAAAHAYDQGEYVVAQQLSLLARAEAADVFAAASDALIQVSGGIGFTWEHDAHLFFRRARATAAIGGTPAELRDRAVLSGCLDILVRVGS